MPFSQQTVLIGSNGFEDFLAGIENNEIEKYQRLSDFMKEEQNFKNLIQIPKLLQKYSNKGVSKDDCSLVIVKN